MQFAWGFAEALASEKDKKNARDQDGSWSRAYRSKNGAKS